MKRKKRNETRQANLYDVLMKHTPGWVGCKEAMKLAGYAPEEEILLAKDIRAINAHRTYPLIILAARSKLTAVKPEVAREYFIDMMQQAKAMLERIAEKEGALT